MSSLKKQRRKIHLNKVCRSCLTEQGRLREIHNTRIPMMMEYCTSVQVANYSMLMNAFVHYFKN